MTHRPIDISAQDPVDPVATTAARPRMEWVDIDQLRVDESYQRPLAACNWRIIRRIAVTFDWARFTPVMCAPMTGGLALIDGQHRAHAAALAGMTSIPAMIVDIATNRQASAFTAINTQRTTVGACHIFRAALVSREPWAIAAARAVDAAGCRLMTSNHSAALKKSGEIYAVSLVRTHVQAGNDRLVTQVLNAIRASARCDEIAMYQSRILKPLLAVLAGEPRVQLPMLARFITDTDLIRARDTVGNLRARAEYTRLSDYELAKRAFRALLHQAQHPGSHLGGAT
jgi:ParB/Sulfiredoxin domain